MKAKRATWVTCHHCSEDQLLSSLTILNIGTNDYEEDVVEFDCPECGKRVKDAIIWTRR